jgi:hypothetical protein
MARDRPVSPIPCIPTITAFKSAARFKTNGTLLYWIVPVVIPPRLTPSTGTVFRILNLPEISDGTMDVSVRLGGVTPLRRIRISGNSACTRTGAVDSHRSRTAPRYYYATRFIRHAKILWRDSRRIVPGFPLTASTPVVKHLTW